MTSLRIQAPVPPATVLANAVPVLCVIGGVVVAARPSDVDRDGIGYVCYRLEPPGCRSEFFVGYGCLSAGCLSASRTRKTILQKPLNDVGAALRPVGVRARLRRPRGHRTRSPMAPSMLKFPRGGSAHGRPADANSMLPSPPLCVRSPRYAATSAHPSGRAITTPLERSPSGPVPNSCVCPNRRAPSSSRPSARAATRAGGIPFQSSSIRRRRRTHATRRP